MTTNLNIPIYSTEEDNDEYDLNELKETMTTKPLYILIKLDVDEEIVTKDNVETYVNNHCNAFEYKWEDYLLGSEEHPNVRINEEEIWIEGENNGITITEDDWL